jgi:phospho-N-acetylmuramoyl-pentapeptide-transferase
MSFLVAALLSFSAVAGFVHLAHRFGWGKSVRKDGPKSHLVKEGTPTMGGVPFILVAAVVWLLMGEKSSSATAVMLLTLSAALLGWLDDVLSLRRKRKLAQGEDASTGLLARYRLLGQGLSAFIFSLYVSSQGFALFGFMWLDVVAFSLIIMGSINAVNFSDGLDGLAAGIMVIMLLPFLSHPFTWPLLGALLGFLWHNAKPAAVFMGGVGSEALGAALAGIAITSPGWIWYLPLIALVPVAEVLSVIIQVSYFKSTGGKRFFKMSPIHHHFEESGWSEIQVVMRFWLITAFCVVAAFALRFGL